jgi:hypothetical protein
MSDIAINILNKSETYLLETALAQNHSFDIDRILMKTTHHRNKYELLIAKNLDWFRDLELS